MLSESTVFQEFLFIIMGPSSRAERLVVVEMVKKKIKELKPSDRDVDVVFSVVEKESERNVTSRQDGLEHRVAEYRVADETGSVKLTLWDEDVDRVEVGKTYELKHGYTSTFRGQLRLRKGRYGQLSESEEEVEPNTSVDMSEEVHREEGFRPRRRRF